MTVSLTSYTLFVLDCTKSQSTKGWAGSEQYDYLLSTLMFLLNRFVFPYIRQICHSITVRFTRTNTYTVFQVHDGMHVQQCIRNKTTMIFLVVNQ